jgi:hypothetical protein
MRDVAEVLRGILAAALFGGVIMLILAAGQMLEWAMDLPV